MAPLNESFDEGSIVRIVRCFIFIAQIHDVGAAAKIAARFSSKCLCSFGRGAFRIVPWEEQRSKRVSFESLGIQLGWRLTVHRLRRSDQQPRLPQAHSRGVVGRTSADASAPVLVAEELAAGN